MVTTVCKYAMSRAAAGFPTGLSRVSVPPLKSGSTGVHVRS